MHFLALPSGGKANSGIVPFLQAEFSFSRWIFQEIFVIFIS